MFARFTDEARGAVVLAQEEAARLRYPWLGTEHLLLGLLRQPGSHAGRVLGGLGVTTAAVETQLVQELGPPHGEQDLGREDEEALRALGIDLEAVRRKVEEAFGPGALDRARPGQCGVPMMPRFKQTIERAARLVGPTDEIDTDHLLLGIMQVRGALATTCSRSLGWVRPTSERAWPPTVARRAEVPSSRRRCHPRVPRPGR